MRAGSWINAALAVYLLIFFGYLLGPLIIMGITAFNSPAFPRAFPFECLTFEWFDVLMQDERILNGVKNSLIVGAGTVVLSVILGLAAALLLTQLWPKLRATFYTVVIAPILIPGVVLGISTLIFWDRVNVALGLPNDSFLHNGLLLTVLGQSTFIASYCMLIFIARLQRFDSGLTEAALDLGASHTQAFRRILLPFLMPAIFSAAVIAFLASFENYNTTTFTFGKYPTLTIELAQKVRYGINPSISSLAVLIVVLTLFFALVNEVTARRRALALANGAPAEAFERRRSGLPGWLTHPTGIALGVLVAAIVGTVVFAQAYSPDACKADVRAEKQLLQQERIEALQRERQERREESLRRGPDIFQGSTTDRTRQPGDGSAEPDSGPARSPGAGTFGDVFAPGNLNGGDGADEAPEPEGAAPANPGAGTFGNVFAPGNLTGGDNAPEPQVAPEAEPSASPFGNVFAPENLTGGDGAENQ